MSDQMWFQKVINASDGFPGFWMCPTPNCSGAGFCFDIFPTDPDHPANEGWHDLDELEEDEDSEAADPKEWDPEESKYKELDEEYGEEDDDLGNDDEYYDGGDEADEMTEIDFESSNEPEE